MAFVFPTGVKPQHWYRLGSVWLGSSLAERDLVGMKLNMSQQCAAAATKENGILGCICRGITSRDRDVIIPLSTFQAAPGVLCPVLVLTIQDERLKEIGLFSLEKRRLRGDLITVFWYLKGSYKEDGGFLFTRSHMEKTRDNGFKLYWERFHLDLGNKFFTSEDSSSPKRQRLSHSVFDYTAASPTTSPPMRPWEMASNRQPPLARSNQHHFSGEHCSTPARSRRRIIEWFQLERTFKDHLVQPPLPWAGTSFTRLLKGLSNLTLNTSRDGASTASLGNLFQCFTTLLKDRNKVSPEPSLLQAEQPQLSQPFLIGKVFQPSNHFRGPPLDPL
ncbi:LOW QUALITY PROTEIN: hypothetical protein QYF61_008786 [Mycteria americana]|uniref:Uncharacterized protein n=1 Tax=Mycteria americana TaxID=33587 RepID=A0AAN7RKT1_MYCAM|nr:LOW QUALITY PROTEIN: hypothetical protein QYF61_008786 [Mycteria americana]